MMKTEWQNLYRKARWDRRAMPDNQSRQRNIDGTTVSSLSDMVLIYPSLDGPRTVAANRSLAFSNFGAGISVSGRTTNLMFQKAHRVQADQHGFKLP